jgi:hypothetical protein
LDSVPNSVPGTNGTRIFATDLSKGSYVMYNRIHSASLVVSRSVNLGTLQMPPRRSEP